MFSLEDLSAWVTATGNVDLLRQLQQALNARLSEVETVKLGGEGAQLLQPHVQATGSVSPGPLTARPAPQSGPTAARPRAQPGPKPQSAQPAAK